MFFRALGPCVLAYAPCTGVEFSSVHGNLKSPSAYVLFAEQSVDGSPFASPIVLGRCLRDYEASTCASPIDEASCGAICRAEIDTDNFFFHNGSF